MTPLERHNRGTKPCRFTAGRPAGTNTAGLKSGSITVRILGKVAHASRCTAEIHSSLVLLAAAQTGGTSNLGGDRPAEVVDGRGDPGGCRTRSPGGDALLPAPFSIQIARLPITMSLPTPRFVGKTWVTSTTLGANPGTTDSAA